MKLSVLNSEESPFFACAFGNANKNMYGVLGRQPIAGETGASKGK